MVIRSPRPALALFFAMTVLGFAGCNSAPPALSATDRAKLERTAQAAETQSVAEAALGKQAEVLAKGDLARDGLQQLLVVNRLAHAQDHSTGAKSSQAVLILRAAILEKDGGKWTEVLRCDEHLKNQNGYLGGTPVSPVTGWSLEFSSDDKSGLELQFSSAAIYDAKNVHTGQWIELKNPVFIVRWNQRVKRYQSLDQSHERFLNEVPTLETPYSILK